ncbi:MAG: hypothetical protein ACM3RX_00990 [Methanococcaceae archaeon]
MKEFIHDDMEFIESGHRYVLKSDPGIEFTSCTTFVNYFFKAFDKVAIAKKLTATHPNYQNMSPEKLIAQWDQTGIDGVAVHKEVENFINTGALPTLPKSIQAVEFLQKQNSEAVKIMSEIVVFSKELGIAGTVDLLIYDKATGCYYLRDWKTSKKIEMSSYGNKRGNHPATSAIMDCNYYHYSLQLSLYRYILETCYGINITDCEIYHLTDNSLSSIKCDYHKDIIEEMLKADKSELRKKFEDSLTEIN